MVNALIVGLGNPGATYRGTRHNIGFETIDELAKSVHARWMEKKKCLIAKVIVDERVVVLAKPQTFMNLSGGPVLQCASKYAISHENIIVIHDDMDLELGRVRVKLGGGDGGHKGVRSISESLGTDAFLRIRLGIGRPPQNRSAEQHVLEKFRPSEKTAVAFLITQGMEAARLLLKHDYKYVQNIVHANKFTSDKTDGQQGDDFSLATTRIL